MRRIAGFDDAGRVVRVAFTEEGHDLADMVAAEVTDVLAAMAGRLNVIEQ